MTRRRPFLLVSLTALITATAILLVMNLSGGEKMLETHVESAYGMRDPQFRRTMSSLLSAPLLGGNRVDDLQNGTEIFPPMLEAIRGARKSITFETYIYWSGEVGRQFADALSERAKAGVPVHVLLDWVGSSKMEPKFLDQLRAAGVEVERFHEPRWYTLSRLNNRTHRKLLVVDGTVAFTGGVGIADQWTGDAQDPEHWRDTHYRLEGPAAASFQAVFLDNWTKATGRVLHGPAYFPAIEPAGDTAAQMVSSSPSGGSEAVHLMYLLALAAARETIVLSSSYFVPDDVTVEALLAAVRRGVSVRIVTPGPLIDTKIVRAASRARWGELLAAGVRIAEYQPTMYHVKMLAIDGVFVSVGSTNFDNRSFRLNDEANLNVYDTRFAGEAMAVFDADWANSTPITFEAWSRRPWREKAWEHLASWLGPQL
ncbi:MAG: cardiolipin synthase [Rhizobacter sp.]